MLSLSKNPKQIAGPFPAVETVDGANVTLHRALPHPGFALSLVDPFLMLDEGILPAIASGFPSHPHRGFEILTLSLAGRMAHEDSLGNSHILEPGGLMRIRAGAGLWHSELMVPGSREDLHFLQIWINLSQQDKQSAPDFKALAEGEIPVRQMEGGRVRILAGKDAAASLKTEAQILDVSLQGGASFEQSVPHGWQGYAYAFEGEGLLDRDYVLPKGCIAPLAPHGGLHVRAKADGLRFLLALGRPHREPVRWRGPYVD